MFWVVAFTSFAFFLAIVVYFSLCRLGYKKGYKEGYTLGNQVGYEAGQLDFLESLNLLEKEKQARRKATIQKVKHLSVVK